MSANSRAIDLPHEGFGSTFLDTFDRPQRVTVCECERSAGATLGQVLLLANSDEVENKIADGNGRIQRLFTAMKSSTDSSSGQKSLRGSRASFTGFTPCSRMSSSIEG